MKTKPFYVRRWGMIGLMALLLLPQLFSFTPVMASSLNDSDLPAFSDGEWEGKFSIISNTPTQVTNITTAYKGEMGFISAGGKLNGDWTLNGNSSYGGDISGSATFDAGGKVIGTSDALQMKINHFIIHMNINVDGTSTKQDVDMGTGTGMEVQLKSATCSMATADIVATTAAGFDAAGTPSKVTGSFVAIRVGDLSAADQVNYMDAVADLLDKAEAFELKIKTGQVPGYKELNDLVSQADSLNMAIVKNIECGLGGKKQFLTIITDVVAKIAYLALENPHLFTTDQLNRLLFVAVQVGAIGSGAANQQQAADLEAKFLKELSDRLDDAKNSKYCYDALIIQIAAGALGNANLKQQAQSVVDANC